jgi:hypothetical protein
MRSMVEREAQVTGAMSSNIGDSLSDLAPPGHLCLRERKVRAGGLSEP